MLRTNMFINKKGFCCRSSQFYCKADIIMGVSAPGLNSLQKEEKFLSVPRKNCPTTKTTQLSTSCINIKVTKKKQYLGKTNRVIKK
jgi:hypothetical protein